jgi:hypothetical protein
LFLYRQKNKHKRTHVNIHVTQKIKRTNQTTKIDGDNLSYGLKTTPPKSHKKVNHGDIVNASEL